VLNGVRQNGMLLEHVPRWCDDLEIVEEAARQNPKALQFASRNCAKEILSRDGKMLRFASLAMRQDRELVHAAVLRNPSSICFGSREVILSIVAQNPRFMPFIPQSMQEDREFILAVASQNPQILIYVSLELRSDRNFALSLVEKNGMALEFLNSSLCYDQAIVRMAIAQNPRALQFAPMRVVGAIVEENGLMLQFASTQARNNINIAMRAAIQNPNALQFTSAANQHRIFPVLPTRIAKQPTSILIELLERIEKNNGVPPKVVYVGSPAIDAGGVTRDFTSKLIAALFLPSQKDLTMLRMDQRHLPVVDPSEKRLPLSEQIRCYKAIGEIFGGAVCGYQSIKTGTHFHPVLFEMIHALVSDANLRESLLGLDLEGGIPNDLSRPLFAAYLKSRFPQFSDPEIEDVLDKRPSQSLIEKGFDDLNAFHEALDFPSICMATVAIAKTMISRLRPAQIRSIGESTPQKLQERVEGVSISRGNVLSAIAWEGLNDSRTREFLTTWIREANRQQLTAFVSATTGRRTLAQGQKLNVRIYRPEPDRLPQFHTCSDTIDLSSRSPSYEKFKESLEFSLGEALGGSGFQAV